MQCSKCSSMLYPDETVKYKFQYSYKFSCKECDVKNNIIRDEEFYNVTSVLSVHPIYCSSCNNNIYTRKTSLYFEYNLCSTCNKEFVASYGDSQLKPSYVISNKSRWSTDCDVCKIHPKDPGSDFVNNLSIVYLCKECDLFYGARLMDLKNNHYTYYGDFGQNKCWNCQKENVLLRFAQAYLIHLQCCKECFTKNFDNAK